MQADPHLDQLRLQPPLLRLDRSQLCLQATDGLVNLCGRLGLQSNTQTQTGAGSDKE